MDDTNKTEKAARTALALSAMALVALMPLTRIADPDLFFHLRLGSELISTLGLYSTDTFSFTFTGAPQYTGEWLSNGLIYLSYRLAGFYGLGLLKSALLLLLMYTVWRTLRLADPDGEPLPQALLIVLLAFAVRFRLDLRPYYFTYISLAAFTYAFYRHRSDGRGLYPLVPLQALWGNLHGGFVLGPAYLGLFVLAEAIRRRAVPVAMLPPLLLVALVSGLNPHGFQPFTALLNISPGLAGSGGGGLGEWQSTSWQLLFGYGLRYTFGFQAIVAGAAAHLVWQALRRRLDPMGIALFAACVYYGLSHVRLMAIASILLAPMAYMAASRLYGLLPRRDAIRAWACTAGAAGIATLTVAAVLMGSVYSFGFGPKYGVLPEGALGFMQEHGVTGKGFNSVTAGSYMLWRTPGRKVFIDGRLVPAPEVNADYDRAIEGMEGFSAMVRKYGVTYALLDYDRKSWWRFPAHINLDPEWVPVYWDRASVLYLLKTPGNMPLIEKFGYRIARPNMNNFTYLDHFTRSGAGALALAGHDVALNPGNPEALMAMAYLQYYMGLREQALRTTRQAAGITPGSPYVHTALAVLLMQRGDRAGAEAELRRALRLDPRNKAARQLLERLKGGGG